MVMSTRISREAALLFTRHILLDTVQIMDVGNPVTKGAYVTRSLTPVGDPVPGLVQTTVLANAVEGLTENVYSVKVSAVTDIKAGQAVKVISCEQEPDLVDKVVLLDKVSQNGAAILRKGVGTDATVVNQEGKEVLL